MKTKKTQLKITHKIMIGSNLLNGGIMEYFIEYLSEKTREYDIHLYEKVNIRIFRFIDKILTYFDPETFDLEEEEEYTYVMLLTMYD